TAGRAVAPCMHAAAAVAMALPKVGTGQYPAAARMGRLFVADIGIPAFLVQQAQMRTELVTAAWVDGMLPRRAPDANKGRFGRIGVVGGARGYAGAPVLAARGAIRMGAGLVTIGLPASLAAVPPASLPEAMTRPLPETNFGTISADAYDAVLKFAGSSDVLAVGPGLTTHPEVVALVRSMLPSARRPIVLDADGLNAFAAEVERLRDASAALVITPHPG